ncbi:GHKL domain-containing protein [bacterium]|nr:GHKL domain-containing protein [bacterium]
MKFKFQRLKIIEQIAIVFFFAVVIPMSISGFIINNINQQSVRYQLRESAMLIASMVSDEMDFLIRSYNITPDEISRSYARKHGVELFKSLQDDNRQIYILNNRKHLIASHNFTDEVFKDTMEALPKGKLLQDTPVLFGDEKNQPMVYLDSQDPDYLIIVRTTEGIAKNAIVDNRVKIILAVLFTILSTMVVIGFYMLYLYINVRQLFKAIMALSKGNYEHKIRLLKTYFTPYELVFLTNEFNTMASEIHKSYLELKEKNVELKSLNEFRSNLIDTVSHELRTPLTSIQGYTSRLMRNDIVLDEEMRQKSLRIIKEQSERLKRLIDDLLTIPDIEGMRLRTEITEVYPSEVFEQSELLLRKHDGHEIIVNLDNNFPKIMADKGRLEQVIVNLYENAVKYSYPETDIIVDTYTKDDKAVIVVKNKCDKISRKKLDTLFDKFVRLDSEMTRTTRGTGLGLFIVKGLVEAMNGIIELDSNDEYGFIAKISLNIAGKDNV